MQLFLALAIAVLPATRATVRITPVVSATVNGRVNSTTTVFRNDGLETVQCEAVYAIPNDPKQGTLRGNYVVKAGEVLVDEGTLMTAGAVGTLRFECSSAVFIAARVQTSTDGGKTFDGGRIFLSVGEENPIAAGIARSFPARSDFLIMEANGKPARVRVVVTDRKGKKLGEMFYDIDPFGEQIVNLSGMRASEAPSVVEITSSGSGAVLIAPRSEDPSIAALFRPTASPSRVKNISTLTGEAAMKLLTISSFKAAPFAEPMTGLVYMRERWYDPRTGTFLSPDPAGYRDSANLNSYCHGDPVNCSDPTGLAASIGRNGWIAATDNRNGGRMRRFSPATIAAHPQQIRAFLGLNADVDPREADAMIEKAGAAWATGATTMHVVATGAAKAAGVYPLMAMTAGAGIGGAAGGVVSADLELGFVGSTMLTGFTGGVGSQAGADLQSRHWSGARSYAVSGSVGAAGSLAIGGAFVGLGRLFDGPAGVPSLDGVNPDDWFISDNAYVRFDPSRYDKSIADSGLERIVFRDEKIWLTRYGFIRNLKSASELESVLYRQNLWPEVLGRFDRGATLRLVKNADDAVLAGVTNRINGVPQWRLLRDIPRSDLQIIRRLPGNE